MVTTKEQESRDGTVPLNSLALAIIGPPGSGKTTLLGTLPGRGFVLNTLPAERGAPILLASKRDRIQVESVNEWKEIDPWYQKLKGGGYDWFALDSFTGLGVLARRRALKERAGRGLNIDPALMSKQDWGNMGGFLDEALFQFLGLPMLKVFVAQERRYESEGLDSQIGPETRPAVLGFFCQSMNGIGRIYSMPIAGGTMERRFRVASHPSYMTKWQLDMERAINFPNIIRNPNLTQILGYAYGPSGKYPPPDGVDESSEQANIGLTEI